jgi:ESCRT-I complex subunit VPS28
MQSTLFSNSQISYFWNVYSFINKQLDCRLAMVRIKEDKPITIKDDKGDSRKLIAQIVSVCA